LASRSDGPVAVVDLGGTKFIAAVVDGGGKILSRLYCPTLSSEGPEKIIARLSESIRQAIDKSGEKVVAVSIAAAAIIDIKKGLITEAPNLPRWINVPLRDMLHEEFRMPVHLLNDASAAALGEHALGAGRGIDNLIYMTVSTGIGGSLIINGELYQGPDGSAAEIGHTIIQINGPKCACGRFGCLESLASGTAIARMARQKLPSHKSSLLYKMAGGKIKGVTAEQVTVAAKKGDRLALSIVEEAAGYLGIGLGNLVNIFNPQMIIIGGGVSENGNMLLVPARRAMKKIAFRLPARTVRIVRAGLGANAGMLGAAVYARLQGRLGK